MAAAGRRAACWRGWQTPRVPALPKLGPAADLAIAVTILAVNCEQTITGTTFGNAAIDATGTYGISPLFMLGDVTIQRMDNVAIVVEDLDAAVAFFTELGMELEGKGQVEGLFADRTVGLDGVRSDIAMMRTPDGHSKLELTKYHTPAAVGAEPENPPPNTLGLHRVMFAVDDIDDTVARLRAHGAELLGEVAQFESIFRLCYLRGPAGIIVALAEQIG